MKCFRCGKGNMTPQHTEMRSEIRGEAVLVSTEAMVCSKCGFQTLTDEQSAEYTLRSADRYRESKGLLTGKELKAIRERLGMNQLAFASFLKVGVASVKRWELGLIQDQAMDELIRLRTDIRRAERNLEELRARLAKVDSGRAAPVEFPLPPRHRLKMRWEEWEGAAMPFDEDTCFGA